MPQQFLPEFEPLLSPSFLAKLERLSLGSKRVKRGELLGSRRSLRHGASVEFSDFREYVRGDDLRSVDWKAYARLEKLFVKLFLDEDDLSLHLLLDASRSMMFGASRTKLRFGQELCAALGAIALLEFDRCSFAASPSARPGSPVLRGRQAMPNLLRMIGQIQGDGQAHIANALRSYAFGRRAPGVLVIVSDFYDHNLTRPILERLTKRNDAILVQIVAPEEADPSISLELTEDIRLMDSESNGFVEITITPSMLDEYKERFGKFCADLEVLAKSSGASYLRVSSDTDIERFVLDTLRSKRVVG